MASDSQSRYPQRRALGGKTHPLSDRSARAPVADGPSKQPVPQLHQRLAIAHQPCTSAGIGDHISGGAGRTSGLEVIVDGVLGHQA